MARTAKPFSIRLMLERELNSIDRRLDSLRDQRELVAAELENVVAFEAETGDQLNFDAGVSEE